MSKILSVPHAMLGFLDSSIISSQLKASTWLVIGAILFQAFSVLLTQRIATLLAFLALFIRVVPVVLVSAGKIPNDALKEVVQGKTTAMFPRKDGSPGSPAGRGFALLIIGIKITHPLGILAPGAKETGKLFTDMVDDLNANPTKNGFLSGSSFQAENGRLGMIAYFESMDALHAFAHAPMHREAWNWWNKNVKNMPHLGVYHEAYDIPAHHWEAVYLQIPKTGLGATNLQLPDNQMHSLITDARKGVWKSSSGRMGRTEGKTYDDEDPYRNE